MSKAYDAVTTAIDSMSRKVAGVEALDPEQLLPKELTSQIKKLTLELTRLSDLSKGEDSA
jgi:hypothetical protein